MSSRPRLGLVAAVATLLSAAPLSTIFELWTWLFQSLLVVALIAGAALLARSLRAPVWAQLLAMTSTLLIELTWMFPSGTELLAVVPSSGTFAHFGELLNGAVRDMRAYAVPVPDTDPLLFISVLGIGVVAVVVDLLAVGLRRPALAGLPMLAIYSVPVAVYTDSVPPLPFAVGAVGFLWLLVADNVERIQRFGRRFTGDGRDVDVWEPSPLAAAGRRLAVVGVAVAILLPLTLPGMTGGLLANLGGVGGEGNGPGGPGPGRINLFAALSGQLNQSEVHDLVRVSTTEHDPFYLRFGVADVIGEDGFGVRNPTGRAVTRDLPDPREQSGPGVSHEQFRASVEITSDFNMPLLPVYAEPVATDGLDASWLYDADMQIVFSHRSQSKGEKYSFDYVRSRYSVARLDAAPALPDDHPIRQRFTEVPRVSEVEQLVDRLTAGKKGDYQRVRAIYDYFSKENGFTYKLRTEGGTSSADIVNFLTGKAGFCQQYAAAMAWLARTAGVPARVAFGFTNGTNRDGDTFVLTNLNLHAWTEVYFNGVGWVPFDATPAANVPGSTRSEWAPDIDAPDPVAPSTPSSAGPDANSTADPEGRDRPDRDVDPGLAGAGGPTRPHAPSWPWWAAAGVAALLALLAVPALRRAALRRRRHAQARIAVTAPVHETPPGVARVVLTDVEARRARSHAHAAWDELIDTMIDFRVRVDPSETPRATADRLAAQDLMTDPAVEAVRMLGRAEERARYARGPLPGARLSEALLTVRRSLAAGADRRTRVTAAVLPRSVLLRWQLEIMNASVRLVAGAGRRRERLLRWSPRRLLAGRLTR